MNEQLLTWIVPGLVGYFIYQNARRTIPVHKGNWDFVISLGVFSVISAKLSQKIFGFSNDEITSIIFITTASGIALILGFVFSLLYNFLVEIGKIVDPADRFSRECKANSGKPVLIILKSKKLYCALLIDFDMVSKGESMSDRTLTILPIASACYDGKLMTDQKIYNSTEIKSKIRPITIFARDVESFRPFVQELFDHFKNALETPAQE